jgi:hypothetical protein
VRGIEGVHRLRVAATGFGPVDDYRCHKRTLGLAAPANAEDPAEQNEKGHQEHIKGAHEDGPRDKHHQQQHKTHFPPKQRPLCAGKLERQRFMQLGEANILGGHEGEDAGIRF